jgi:transglutaminase-like putative cysteine protease
MPTSVTGLSSATKWSLQDQLLEDSTISPGDEYDLEVAQPSPSLSELQAANGADPSMNSWLELPPVADYVRSLVASLTANAQTPYDKVRAINDYFTNPKNGFTYSLATQRGDTGNELVDFLQNKFGYCQQYAAAEGVMLRVAGIPARIVLGYTHQIPSKDGTFTITTNDAHSWVEAYFAGIGWIPFDPTPLDGITGGSGNDLPWAPHKNGAAAHTSGPAVSNSVGGNPGARRPTESTAPLGAGSASKGGGVNGGLVALGVLVPLLVLALIPWAVRQRRRLGRLRRARRGDVEALWAELCDTVTDLGYGWSASRTPRQVAQWLERPSGAGAPALLDMTSSVERTRYAPGSAPTDGRRLVNDLAAVRTGLLAGRTWWDKVSARLFPASLGWRIVSMARGTDLGRRAL